MAGTKPGHDEKRLIFNSRLPAALVCWGFEQQKKFPPKLLFDFPELPAAPKISLTPNKKRRFSMKYALVIAAVAVLATPALAEEVGVRVGPVGAGVTVGQSHDSYRDRDRDRTTVIREREPADRTTVIKRDHDRDDGVRSKTIIKERD
jgi:hypothetical protein